MQKSFFVACGLLLAALIPAGAQTYTKPFSSSSPWNSPVPARVAATPIDLSSFDVGLSSWLRPDGSSVPVYDATTATQKGKVLYNANAWAKLASGDWKHFGNSSGVEAEIRSSSSDSFPFPYQVFASQSASRLLLPVSYNKISPRPGSIYSPGVVVPALNADGHLAIFQPNGRVFESYATIVLSNGDLVCLSYNLTDPKSAGDGSQNGVTASMLPIYAGLVRKADYANGSIPHAIKIVVPAKLLRTAFVSPALSFDRGAATETPAYSGSLPMGARLAIPTSVSLNALALKSPLGKMIGAAAQKYGFIITDRGGSGITIMVERNPSDPALQNWDWQAAGDLKTIFSKLAWIH